MSKSAALFTATGIIGTVIQVVALSNVNAELVETKRRADLAAADAVVAEKRLTKLESDLNYYENRMLYVLQTVQAQGGEMASLRMGIARRCGAR
jgi:hypothetical protein